MGGVLYTVISFLVAIAILVAIHEFGHFWVAKKLGVKVLRFSIGFGKPLWSKRAGPDQTEYVIGALPLGGYVRMLDEREENVPESEKHRAFNRQPLWKRFLIVLAGPVFNFLLAIIAYWIISVAGVTGLKATIGQVEEGSLAEAAGLQPGMQIVKTEGWDTPTWESVFQEALPRLVERSQLHLEAKDSRGHLRNYTINLSSINPDTDIARPFDALGLYFFDTPAVIGKVVDDSAAARAGLEPGDEIVRIGDRHINHWNQVSQSISDKANQTITVVVKRDGRLKEFSVVPEEVTYKGQTFGRIGIAPKIDTVISDNQKAVQQLGVIDSIGYAVHRTWNISYVTLRVLGLMITMDMSVTNISGPINIAVVAGESASIGWERYVLFLALVSVSLGILNLLPVPVLDGGHLLYYIVEAIKGSPVSETTEAIGQRIGLMMLVMLMVLAFYNDIVRLSF